MPGLIQSKVAGGLCEDHAHLTSCLVLASAGAQGAPSLTYKLWKDFLYRLYTVQLQVADMLEAAVARSNSDEDSRQQATKSGMMSRGLHFPKDPVSAAKKVHTFCFCSDFACWGDSWKGADEALNLL